MLTRRNIALTAILFCVFNRTTLFNLCVCPVICTVIYFSKGNILNGGKQIFYGKLAKSCKHISPFTSKSKLTSLNVVHSLITFLGAVSKFFSLISKFFLFYSFGNI